MADLAVMVPAKAAAPDVVALGQASAAAGLDELWVPEDLGLHGGVALVASLLAAVERVPVGLAIAPAAARHPAFLAMQAATLAQLHPGRLRLGIGHGMPRWMRQLGVWPRSPLTHLAETFEAVRGLLAGNDVHLDGHEVTVEGVRLDTAPVEVPLLAGVRGPRSLELAARVADGVVLAGWSGPAYTAQVRGLLDRIAPGPVRRQLVASARVAFDPGDPASARQRLTTELGAAIRRNGLAEQLAPAGCDPADLAALGDLGDPADVGDRAGLVGLVDEVGLAGDLGALRAGVSRWADAGADVVLLDPLTAPDLKRLLDAGVDALRP